MVSLTLTKEQESQARDIESVYLQSTDNLVLRLDDKSDLNKDNITDLLERYFLQKKMTKKDEITEDFIYEAVKDVQVDNDDVRFNIDLLQITGKKNNKTNKKIYFNKDLKFVITDTYFYIESIRKTQDSIKGMINNYLFIFEENKKVIENLSNIVLSRVEQDKIIKLISKYNASVNSQELEIRFGSVSNKKFNPEISLFEYNLLLDFFEKYIDAESGIKEMIETEEKILDNSVRIILNKRTNEISYMKKTKEENANTDLNEYGVRFSLSNEEEVDKSATNNASLELVRIKKRNTYILSSLYPLKFDLTYIQILDSKEKESGYKYKYEMEIEVINGQKISFPLLMKGIETVLRIKQQSFFIMSYSEQASIYASAESLSNEINNKTLPFSKVNQLNKDSINLLKKDKYFFSPKADGERYLSYINNIGELFLINEKRNVIGTGIKSDKFRDIILDSEFIILSSENTVLFFDVLFCKNCIIPDTLADKITLIQQIQTSLTTYNEFSPKVFVKPFYEMNIVNLTSFNQIQFSFPTDGIIFTPNSISNPLNSKTWLYNLKYKPPTQLTIDFKLLPNNKDKNTYILSVYNNDKKFIPFEHNGVIATVKKAYGTQMLQQGSIAEFLWQGGLWNFIRYRPDKTLPNHVNIANNVWTTIENPLTLEDLISVLQETEETPVAQQDTKSLFSNMRKFHNQIKRIPIEEYKPSVIYDFASGKGGDIYKWVENEVKRVIGYDRDSESVSEAERRLAEINNRQKGVKYDYTFFVKNLERENLQLDTRADMITCNFAFHYFLRVKLGFEIFMGSVVRNLKKDGIFSITVMNGKKIFELLKNKQEFLVSKDNREVIINKRYDNVDSISNLPSIFGNQILVKSNGDFYLQNGSVEYLVDIDALIKLLKNNYNLQLIERKSFQDLHKGFNIKLSSVEKQLSFFNEILVFKLTSDVVITETKKEIEPVKNFKRETTTEEKQTMIENIILSNDENIDDIENMLRDINITNETKRAFKPSSSRNKTVGMQNQKVELKDYIKYLESNMK